MSNLKAAYINEMYKISKKKKIIVAAILSIAAILLSSLVVSGVNNFMGIRLTGTSEFSLMTLYWLNKTLIPLFTAFICIDMFTGEYSNHTIKFTLTRPASRFKIYSSKVLAAVTFMALNLFFVMLVSMLCSLIFQSGGFDFGKVLISYMAALLPLTVFALMVILIANIARGSASAFMLTIVAFLAFMVLGFAFPDIQSVFFTSSFDWYTLLTGSYINIYKIFRVLLILLGYGMMFFALGYYLFDKKQI